MLEDETVRAGPAEWMWQLLWTNHHDGASFTGYLTLDMISYVFGPSSGTTVAIFLNFALAINYLVRYVSFDSVHETKLTHQLYIYTGSTTVYYNYTGHSCSANAGLTQCMLP